MLNKGNQIQNFMSSSGSGTVINYGSGSEFLASYGSGSGSTSQKVTVPTVPVPVPQHCPQHWLEVRLITWSGVRIIFRTGADSRHTRLWRSFCRRSVSQMFLSRPALNTWNQIQDFKINNKILQQKWRKELAHKTVILHLISFSKITGAFCSEHLVDFST